MSGSIQASLARASLVCSQTGAPRLPSMPPPSSGVNRATEYGHHSYHSVKDVPTQKTRDVPPPSSSELSLAPPSSPAHRHVNSGFDGCSQTSPGLPEVDSSQLAAHRPYAIPARPLSPRRLRLHPPRPRLRSRRRRRRHYYMGQKRKRGSSKTWSVSLCESQGFRGWCVAMFLFEHLPSPLDYDWYCVMNDCGSVSSKHWTRFVV
ncbi:hypothetical protein BC827DRAFT_207123 [Russula dissimulans]|nr:hypothetical protein BC827DRAFT_207123 [Russula dissimulans]